MEAASAPSPPNEIFIFICGMDKDHPDSTRVLVEPGTFLWKTLTVATVTIHNRTETDLLVWMPAYKSALIDLNRRDHLTLEASWFSRLRRRRFKYAVYAPDFSAFALGNSAPQMILDP